MSLSLDRILHFLNFNFSCYIEPTSLTKRLKGEAESSDDGIWSANELEILSDDDEVEFMGSKTSGGGASGEATAAVDDVDDDSSGLLSQSGDEDLSEKQSEGSESGSDSDEPYTESIEQTTLASAARLTRSGRPIELDTEVVAPKPKKPTIKKRPSEQKQKILNSLQSQDLAAAVQLSWNSLSDHTELLRPFVTEKGSVLPFV